MPADPTADPNPEGSERILLSGPDMDDSDRDALLRAFDGGWIAPVGPELTAFERELADYVGVEDCVALASGTAALHLGLLECGVQPGDEVIVQTATFAASAFAVVHAGAVPVFCDIDPSTWSLDPELLHTVLRARADRGRLPAAVMPVDLYGSCADHEAIGSVCAEFEVPVIEDAAEALGSITNGRQAGSFGRCAALSFNGNKVITTGGGGALLGSEELIGRARSRSTQARSPVSDVYHEHAEVGFNYRLSNLLAAIGRTQLSRLEAKIERRTQIHQRYRTSTVLADMAWGPQAMTERPNHWLTVGLLPGNNGRGPTSTEVAATLMAQNIEARPVWKPMHLQPVFTDAEVCGGAAAEELFERGLCLPSGSGLTDEQVSRVIAALAAVLNRP